MISELTLEGVKSFVDRTTIPFAPITVLTGTNSSGKSTVLQSLLLLRNAFERAAGPAALYLNGPGLSIGSYDDWSSNHAGGEASIALTLHEPKPNWAHLAKVGMDPSAEQVVPWRVAPWWMNIGDVRPASAQEQFTISLRCKFERDAANLAVARLNAAEWTLRGGDPALPDVAEAAVKISRADPGPIWMHGVDVAARVPFVLTLDAPAAAGAKIPPLMRCSLDGLLPANVLQDRTEAAFRVTVQQALEFVLVAIAGPSSGGSSASNFSDKLRTHLQWAATISPDADPDTSAGRTQRFVNALASAADETIRHHLRASRRYIARTLLGGALPGRPTARTPPNVLAALASAYVERLSGLLSGAEVAGRARAARNLVEPFRDVPNWRYALALLESYIAKASDGDRVAVLVKRAAAEYEAKEPERRFRALDELFEEELWPLPAPSSVKRLATNYMHHLGPLRDEPRSLYSAEGPKSPEDVGPRGERAVACLRQFGGEPVLAPHPDFSQERRILYVDTLRDAVLRWGRHLEVFEGLEVDSSSYGISCKVVTSGESGVLRADLNNVGVGVSQLLPFLVLALAAPIGSIITVEQPELHLHPSVQTRLAGLIAAIATTGKQVIVETHSQG